MMKKIGLFILVLIAFTITSCSKDEDCSKKDGVKCKRALVGDDSLLIGKWTMMQSITPDAGLQDLYPFFSNCERGVEYIEFKVDGTVEEGRYKDESCELEIVSEDTWKKEGDKLIYTSLEPKEENKQTNISITGLTSTEMRYKYSYTDTDDPRDTVLIFKRL